MQNCTSKMLLGKIGMALNTNWFDPATDTVEDIEAQERVLQFMASL